MLQREQFRGFLPGLYPVGALLILAPLADVVGAAWPFRPFDLAWRFGAIGLEFRAILTQVAGIALVLTVSVILGHRVVMRAISVFALVVAVLLSAGVTRFIIDYRTLGDAVGAAAGFDVSAFRAVLSAILAIPVLTALGGRGMTSSSPASPAPSSEPERDQVIPFPGRPSPAERRGYRPF